MLKIGLFTFGGGYAMIALLENEFVSKRRWIQTDEFAGMVAIAESTPGPIAVNMATFIGSSQAGFIGALVATLGVILPSFIVILLIAALLEKVMKYAGVQAALSGIRPVVTGLILGTSAYTAFECHSPYSNRSRYGFIGLESRHFFCSFSVRLLAYLRIPSSVKVLFNAFSVRYIEPIKIAI